MRVVHATALTAAALLLASVASAQGLGDAAARERQKRKAAPAQPAKVYTEGDIGRSMAPVSAEPDLPVVAGGEPDAGQPAPDATGDAAAEGGAAPEGAAEGGGAPAPAPPAASSGPSEEEARAKAEAAWRQQLDQARKEEAVFKDIVEKTQLQLNDTSGLYSPSRAAAATYLEESKQKLAQAQAKVAALEAEGRRNLYR